MILIGLPRESNHIARKPRALYNHHCNSYSCIENDYRLLMVRFIQFVCVFIIKNARCLRSASHHAVRCLARRNLKCET